MTLDELRTKKLATEAAIVEIMGRFTAETGVLIKSVGASYQSGANLVDRERIAGGYPKYEAYSTLDLDL